MKRYRIKAHTGPMNSSETIYVDRLKAAGFTEVYQGTEYVYGTLNKDFENTGTSSFDSHIQKAIDFASGILGPSFGYPSVRCIGCAEDTCKECGGSGETSAPLGAEPDICTSCTYKK